MVRVLDRKLLRDLRQIWAQTLAIALVLGCGIMVMVAAYGTQRSLVETQAAYYDRHRFADLFVAATRVPVTRLAELADIDHVAQVDGRISFHAVLDIDGMQAPAVGQVLSLAADAGQGLNVPLLRHGRLPDPDRLDEVALNESFAQAHDLVPGSRFRAVLNGQLRELQVTGWLLSPEFIYTMAPGTIMPDDRRFGLIWMNEAAAAAAMDMQGAVNDIALRLMRGADARAVIAQVDSVLDPFGGTGAHGRDRQTSHAFLDSELTQLDALARFLPPVFLVVAAFLVNMVLGRLIAMERAQIGLMRALGYRRAEIGLHYLKLAGMIGLLGVGLGWGGGLLLREGMLLLYVEFFRFPFLIRDPALGAMGLSGALALAAVLAGAARAVAAAIRLPPAEAMSPPAPPSFGRGRIDRAIAALRLRQTSMMILRSVLRWPGRAAITLLGVSTSVGVLVASYFLFDAIDVVRDRVFQQGNRQHVTLTLARDAPDSVLLDALTLPGVTSVQGGYALPVRLVNGHRSRQTAVIAQFEGAELAQVMDDEQGVITLSDRGLVLPELVARHLRISAGDSVQLDLLVPPRDTLTLPVTAIIRQGMGSEAHIAAPALFAAMRVAPRVNQIHLRIDPQQMPALQARIKSLPTVAGFADWEELRAQFDASLQEGMLTMVMIYTLIGVLIAIGVVYNAARIQLSERSHELASLRVLGFTRAEVGFVLIGEMMLLTLLAVPLGWVMGYAFAQGMVDAISTDVVQLPFVISRRTYALAALVVVGASLAAVLLVRRRLDRVDLVSALKARD
ncbi:ABC transporter permease [Roseinatronobacter alkalisoli]|uniref:ABC transporter permease n=1 Tax=Roseinatronobacter alkalisoli TaxID=3028235 RepID=A0ABT5T8K8_9RHOB|nr:ABC transporter permease [Roseinatronobacter sp. HJB301]MDD7971460.1 ABC transporter permease [Roseinatronobacter sp. HJB301]